MEQKKLALCLFGISFGKTNHGSISFFVNYENSYKNYQEYIYKYFKNKGYSIDVYFSTNILNDGDKAKLIDTYKPVACSFKENDKDFMKSRNIKVDSVIDLCLESKIIYDLVLLTRFDLLFLKKFEESNIVLDKFNLVSTLENPEYICDNFYLFPFSILSKFSLIIKKNMSVMRHFIKHEIDNIAGIEFINYILKENTTVGNLSFYKIVRTPA